MRRFYPLVLLLSVLNISADEISVLSPYQFTEGTRAEISISAPKGAKAALQWRIGLENKTLASGGQYLNEKGEGVITVHLPRLRVAEALPLQLVLFETGKPEKLTEITLWVFPEDPLFATKLHLQKHPLQVFDPVGDTRDWLESAGLPFERCLRPEDAGEGLLVVGEGLSFDAGDHDFEALRKLAESGRQVLVLCPQVGELKLWEPDTNDSRPKNWQLLDADFVENMDKRLRHTGLENRFFDFSTDHGEPHLQVTQTLGWAWAEFHYQNGGTLALCGVQFMAEEQDSPAGHILFEHLLKKLKPGNGENNEKIE